MINHDIIMIDRDKSPTNWERWEENNAYLLLHQKYQTLVQRMFHQSKHSMFQPFY